MENEAEFCCLESVSEEDLTVLRNNCERLEIGTGSFLCIVIQSETLLNGDGRYDAPIRTNLNGARLGLRKVFLRNFNGVLTLYTVDTVNKSTLQCAMESMFDSFSPHIVFFFKHQNNYVLKMLDSSFCISVAASSFECFAGKSADEWLENFRKLLCTEAGADDDVVPSSQNLSPADPSREQSQEIMFSDNELQKTSKDARCSLDRSPSLKGKENVLHHRSTEDQADTDAASANDRTFTTREEDSETNHMNNGSPALEEEGEENQEPPLASQVVPTLKKEVSLEKKEREELAPSHSERNLQVSTEISMYKDALVREYNCMGEEKIMKVFPCDLEPSLVLRQINEELVSKYKEKIFNGQIDPAIEVFYGYREPDTEHIKILDGQHRLCAIKRLDEAHTKKHGTLFYQGKLTVYVSEYNRRNWSALRTVRKDTKSHPYSNVEKVMQIVLVKEELEMREKVLTSLSDQDLQAVYYNFLEKNDYPLYLLRCASMKPTSQGLFLSAMRKCDDGHLKDQSRGCAYGKVLCKLVSSHRRNEVATEVILRAMVDGSMSIKEANAAASAVEVDIRHHLRQKGIPPDEVEKILENTGTDDLWTKALSKLNLSRRMTCKTVIKNATINHQKLLEELPAPPAPVEPEPVLPISLVYTDKFPTTDLFVVDHKGPNLLRTFLDEDGDAVLLIVGNDQAINEALSTAGLQDQASPFFLEKTTRPANTKEEFGNAIFHVRLVVRRDGEYVRSPYLLRRMRKRKFSFDKLTDGPTLAKFLHAWPIQNCCMALSSANHEFASQIAENMSHVVICGINQRLYKLLRNHFHHLNDISTPAVDNSSG